LSGELGPDDVTLVIGDLESAGARSAFLVARHLIAEVLLDLFFDAQVSGLVTSGSAVLDVDRSFSFLCAVVGMICTMSVSIIFPAAAHLKMFGDKLAWYEKLLDSMLVVVGVVMAIVGTIVTLPQI